MSKFTLLTVTLLLCFKAATAAAQTTLMKPGLWEIILTNQVANKDSRQIFTSRSCYSAADIASAQRSLPMQGEMGMKCTLKDYKLVGADAKWQVSCVGKASTLSGMTSVKFAAEKYQGQALLNSKAGGKAIKITQKIQATRISNC